MLFGCLLLCGIFYNQNGIRNTIDIHSTLFALIARNEGQIAVQLHIGGGDKILGSGNMEYADILLEELP